MLDGVASTPSTPRLDTSTPSPRRRAVAEPRLAVDGPHRPDVVARCSTAIARENEMSTRHHEIENKKKQRRAGNTTAAIGKGFAIGSAALVSFALYGAFVVRLGITTGVNVLTPLTFAALLVGANLPTGSAP